MIGFHEIRFPEDVSWGSSGGPVYKTQVFTSHMGYEKRNIDWSQPMMEFNAAYGVKTDDQIARVIDFFNARQGQLFGFRYKNWCNFNIQNAPIATGDGYSKRLPIYKFYGFVGTRHYKRLHKIVRGSVRGVQIGSDPAIEGRDFYIDYDSGEIVVNDAPGYASPIYAQNLEFDEPVRFDDDNIENIIEAYNNNALNKLTLVGVRGVYSTGSVFSPDLREAGTRDVHFGSVVLMLNFDDGQVSTTQTKDHSLMNAVVEFSGTAHIDTQNFRHGNGSLSMGATGSVRIAGQAQDLSNGPFTIEVFAQRPREGAVFQPIVARWDAPAMQKSYMLRYNLVKQRVELLVSDDGVNERIVISHPWDFNYNYFDYIRVDRLASGWWVLRINGLVKQTARDFGLVNAGSAPCSVGCNLAPSADEGPFLGLIDSIRLTAGVARDDTFNTVEIPKPYGRLGTTGVYANPTLLVPNTY